MDHAGLRARVVAGSDPLFASLSENLSVSRSDSSSIGALTALYTTVLPTFSDTTSPARDRIARWALIALGAVPVAAASSPDVTPSGSVPTRRVKTSKLIPALEIYFVDGSKPSGDHPWLGEADKVVWRDPATGYECIMLRNAAGGFLEGYVGVPRDHPLYGFDRHALPDGLGIAVHGGIGYAEICEDGPTPQRRTVREEARRICHVPSGPARYQPTEHATDYRVEDDHAWWFGFACNGPTDVVPIDPLHRHRDSAAAGGIRQTYRDDGYVCGEVLNLAAQLRAIQDGLPMPERTGPPLPPVGLAPKREG